MPPPLAPKQARAAPSLRVLAEGAHHVVVDKRCNTVVVPGRGTPRPALLDVVSDRFGRGVRPVHRLDRGTSGCCVFAKSPFGEQALTAAFRRRLVEKWYLAVVSGEPDVTRASVDARLLRVDAKDAKRGPLAWQTVDEAGEAAHTDFEVLARADDRGLVLAKPRTGRMHQIRVHLAHLGHPILDDTLYGGTLPSDDHSLMLHAFALLFPAPKGGRCVVRAPLPPRIVAAFPGAERAVAPLLTKLDAAVKKARATQERKERERRAREESPRGPAPKKKRRTSRRQHGHKKR